jgi:hypothetical protein
MKGKRDREKGEIEKNSKRHTSTLNAEVDKEQNVIHSAVTWGNHGQNFNTFLSAFSSHVFHIKYRACNKA